MTKRQKNTGGIKSWLEEGDSGYNMEEEDVRRERIKTVSP